jgi:ricin-type beta-trefoil lectin protein
MIPARTLLLAAPLAGFLAGCLDDGEGIYDDDPTGDGVAASAITGTTVGFLDGMIEVNVGGVAHTGFLLESCTAGVGGCPSPAPLLVLTSEDWAQQFTPASSITLRRAYNGGGVDTRTGSYVNDSAYFPGAIIQAPGFTTLNKWPLDSRAPAALVGVSLSCYEYAPGASGTVLKRATVTVASNSGDDLIANTGALAPGDTGAVCIDHNTQTAVAMLVDVQVNGAGTPIRSVLRRYASLQEWLGGMKLLAQVRVSGNAHLALYNDLAAKKCMDVPWGSPFISVVNQYTCHSNQGSGIGLAQRFWLDFSLDANRPRLVNESSGKCLDVPSGVLTSGQDLQQYPCHAGLNQRWELTLWPDSAGGWKLRPAHAPSQNLCISVDGGPTWQSRPLEQRSCSGTTDQRWFPIWVP